MNLRGKRVVVMGLGVHGGGLGVARFLVNEGADVTVTDMCGPDALRATLDALQGLPIRYVLHEHREEDFRQAEIVVRNPGVPRESRFLQIARAAGAQIEMEMTLFFRRCPAPIIGITGTKGKTTTTMLCGAMLREQFPDTVVAGNLRVSALEQLPQITPTTPVVLELSSFVLEGLGEAKLSPQYACITNISPDHLDRYRAMDQYVEAKKQIFLHQKKDDVVVLNYDDSVHREWAASASSAVSWFARKHEMYKLLMQPVMIYSDKGLAWLDPRTLRAGKIAMPRIIAPDDVALPGLHNLANIAAAAALAKAYGVTNENIRNAVRKFTGVEHRLEPVRELDGVRYINDTAATAPEAAIAALHSFDAPIVLIAGGADKNLPFDALGKAIAERAKAVVLLAGSATEKLRAAIRSQGLEVRGQGSGVRGQGSGWQLTTDSKQTEAGTTQLEVVKGVFDNFEQAIQDARALASPGDVVLLSPGCASFGMFRNEFHRGEEFRRIVNQL